MSARQKNRAESLLGWILTGALCASLTACVEEPRDPPLAKRPVARATVPSRPSATAPAEPPPGAVAIKKVTEPTVPPPAEPAPSSTFAQVIKRARTLAKKGESARAIASYREAIALDARAAQPHVALARLAIGAKDMRMARQHAERAIGLAPFSSGAWNTLGRIELIEGKLPTAQKAFEAATRHDGDNNYAWNNLGLVRIKLKRYAEAIEALEEAVGGSNPQAYMFNNLGIAYELAQRTEEALSAYKQGLAQGSGVAGKNFVRLERSVTGETGVAG